MLHETTEHHAADSKCNTGGDSQKISNEEKHQRIEENVNKTLKIGPFSVWALGITIVIGGQYFSWNEGLSAGFGSELLSVFFIGTAYICLCLCNAELTSSLPFTGGAYGLARVTLGLFPGFLIGCCEAMEYITYVASATILLSEMLSAVSDTPDYMIPVYSLVIYFLACGILITGGSIFWQISSIIGIISLLILLIFCFGSIPYINFLQNATSSSTTGSSNLEQEYFIDGIYGFMKILPLAAWFFVGIESLNLTASVVVTPKTTIPKGSIACVLTLFICAILVLFITASLPMNNETKIPIAYMTAPFSLGFSLMFNMNENVAIAFSIPATFATAYGFIFAYSRVLISMARSLLFPSFLLKTYGKYHTPYVAILIGSVLGYCLCISVYFMPIINTYLFSICILSAFLAYISQLIGYVIFKIKYDQRERKFTSPLGIFGAIYGCIIFIVAAIAICFFQDDDYINMICISILGSIYTFFYFSYSKKRQNFSSDEKIFFPVHVIKFNDRKRITARKGHKGGGNGDHSSLKSSVHEGENSQNNHYRSNYIIDSISSRFHVKVCSSKSPIHSVRVSVRALLSREKSISSTKSISRNIYLNKIACENDDKKDEKNEELSANGNIHDTNKGSKNIKNCNNNDYDNCSNNNNDDNNNNNSMKINNCIEKYDNDNNNHYNDINENAIRNSNEMKYIKLEKNHQENQENVIEFDRSDHEKVLKYLEASSDDKFIILTNYMCMKCDEPILSTYDNSPESIENENEIEDYTRRL